MCATLVNVADALQSAAAFAIGNILAGHDIEAQDHLREVSSFAAELIDSGC